MSDDLIERLRKLAGLATKGPWTLVVGAKGELYIRTDDDVETISREFPRDEDAEFLAECEPEVIISLLDAIAAKDIALSERDATIERLEKKVAAFRNDGLVQAALARQGHLQDERDEAVEALSDMRAELERSNALAELRQRMLEEALFELEAYRAAALALAPSIQDETDLGVRG